MKPKKRVKKQTKKFSGPGKKETLRRSADKMIFAANDRQLRVLQASAKSGNVAAVQNAFAANPDIANELIRRAKTKYKLNKRVA